VEGAGVGVPAGADVGACAVGAGVGVWAGAGAEGGVVGVTAGGDVGLWAGADVRGAAGEGLDVGLRGTEEARAAGGEADRTGARPADGNVGRDVSGRAGVFARPAVAVGVGVGVTAAFPASDAVEVTPLGALPDLSAVPGECGMSRIPDTAAPTTTAAAAMTGHCQRGDGVPPVPPGLSHPSSAVNGLDTGSKSVSARGLCSVRGPEGSSTLVTGDSPLGAEAGSRTVGAVPRGPEAGDCGGCGCGCGCGFEP